MARKKKYIEAEVIEKAMALFWRNGYAATSMQQLEKEMGINKFSIYASFGSKNGVFLESIKCYKQKLNLIIKKLKASSSGVKGLKQYFYDFISFSKETNFCKGCLVTNTANELGEDADAEIKLELLKFTNEVRQVFADILAQDTKKSSAIIEEEADYLIISMVGLASASRMFYEAQLNHYIENIFKNL
jgi:AcrR family transcriptional regulator